MRTQTSKTKFGKIGHHVAGHLQNVQNLPTMMEPADVDQPLQQMLINVGKFQNIWVWSDGKCEKAYSIWYRNVARCVFACKTRLRYTRERALRHYTLYMFSSLRFWYIDIYSNSCNIFKSVLATLNVGVSTARYLTSSSKATLPNKSSRN